MIENNHKTSLLIPSQLPEFISGNPEYSKFVDFLQAYYEWMELNGKVTDRSKNLLSYKDIDKTTQEFLDYFTNDFLPYFPVDSLTDKRKAIKIAKQIYKAKGTPASYQFLFRVLYDSNFDYYNTKDAVFKASASEWFVATSLKLASSDERFLSLKTDTGTYRLFGEISKTLAVIESSVKYGDKIEIFISNITRAFESGEYIRVIDNNNQDVIVDGDVLRAKIVGQISQIKINPNNRGLLYQPGDPVIISGGLNPDIPFPKAARAEIGTTTTGSIQRINVIGGGFGYRENPDTIISLTNAPDAIAEVGSINPDPYVRANVSFIPKDTLTLSLLTTIGNTNYSFFANNMTANANTTLANSFEFISFSTFPISSVIVQNGGTGISKIPSVTAESLYDTNIGNIKGNLKNLGILAPVQIINQGINYEINDEVVFSGGSGVGAFAKITEVDANGEILKVEYYSPDNSYPPGGLGYGPAALPSANIVSSNPLAANGSLVVPTILGEGATFSIVVDRTGSISTIALIDPGEDYVETPNISLRVQDIVISNVSSIFTPQTLDVVYQGANVNAATYKATVDSFVSLDPTNYRLRVFNYKSAPNPSLPLIVDRANISLTMANTAYNTTYNQYGIRTYGDGTAKASAVFLNGIQFSQGEWITTQGHPSSYTRLQNENYNNYTYQITVSKEIEKYRIALLNLLHPVGMKVIGRFRMESENTFSIDYLNVVNEGKSLYYYTQTYASYAEIVTNFTNLSNNIVSFYNLSGADLEQIIFPDDILALKSDNGQEVISKVISVDNTTNTCVLSTNTWLTYPNVANTTALVNTSIINIEEVYRGINSYDLINNGVYSNPEYPIKDIVLSGDQILVAGNSPKTVSYVDWSNNKIYLTSNVTSNVVSDMSVLRKFKAGGTSGTRFSVTIYGPEGLQYFPEITTEDGQSITTEDDRIILLG